MYSKKSKSSKEEQSKGKVWSAAAETDEWHICSSISEHQGKTLTENFL